MAYDEDARRQLDDLRASGATDARSRLLIDYFTAVIDEQQATNLLADWQRRSTTLQHLRDTRYTAAVTAAQTQADTEKTDWSWRRGDWSWRRRPVGVTTGSRWRSSLWFERVEELLRPQRDVLLAEWRAEFGSELQRLENLTAETRHRRYDAVRRKRMALRELADLGLTPTSITDPTGPDDRRSSSSVDVARSSD